jgi:hypothetical protein
MNKKILYGGLLLLGVVGLYMFNKKSTSVSDTYTESELNDKINKLAKEEYARVKNNPAGVKSEIQVIDGLKILIEKVKKNGFTSKKDIDTLFLLIPKMNDNTLTIEERFKLDKFIEPKPTLTPTPPNAMPLDLSSQELYKTPNEFTIKSNGFNTRYYKDVSKTEGIFSFASPNLYKQPYSTNGMSGVQPTKISTREFLDAYNEFLKQPK